MCAESSSSVESCHHSSSPLREVLADGVEVWLGDCREVLPLIGRVDHVICDPPYEAVMQDKWKVFTPKDTAGKGGKE